MTESVCMHSTATSQQNGQLENVFDNFENWSGDVLGGLSFSNWVGGRKGFMEVVRGKVNFKNCSKTVIQTLLLVLSHFLKVTPWSILYMTV